MLLGSLLVDRRIGYAYNAGVELLGLPDEILQKIPFILGEE